MAKILKKTTGLTGLAVCAYPRRELTHLYGCIMRVLAHFPEDSAYKKHTLKLVQERNDIVLKNEDVETIEKKINCGQIEELIIQAQNELTLAENMGAWKPWENLTEEAPPRQWDWPPHK